MPSVSPSGFPQAVMIPQWRQWAWALSTQGTCTQGMMGRAEATAEGSAAASRIAGTYREHHGLTHSLLFCRKELELFQLCCPQYLSPLD